MKIAVYYIATGDYKVFFKDFIESLQNFYPEDQKIVKLISDGLEEYKDYINGNVTVDLCPRINHYPWPVVTLYKHYHILENWDDSCKYACYFNANVIIYPHINNPFDLTKIVTSYHSFNDKTHTYYPWIVIKLNKESEAYIENKTYEYAQAAFFFGPNKLFKHMCEDIVAMLKKDTNKHIFAQWHDESYFNKWRVMHKDNVVTDYYMTVYPNSITDKTFIFLKWKDKVIDKFKSS